jgi:Fatty acid desaturase
LKKIINHDAWLIVKKITLLQMLENSKIIKWYRCQIDKKVLKQLSTPNDAKGFIYALGHLALWSGAGALSYYNFISGYLLGFIAFFFIQGTIGCFFNAAHHELHHGTVFKTRKLNKVFLNIYGILGWLDPVTYSLSHTFHHRNTLHNGVDYEEVQPKIPSLHILYLIQLFLN